MKTTFQFVIALFFISEFFLSCSKQNEISDNVCCSPPYININNYMRDALDLYVNDIYIDTLHPNRNNPVIEQEPVERIFQQIKAIADLQTPEVYRVFNLLETHAPRVNTNCLWLKVNPGAPETQAIIDGEPTGNVRFDSLVSKYQFTELEVAYHYPDFNWLCLQSTEDWNMIPVIAEFEDFSFIEEIEQVGGYSGYFSSNFPYILKNEHEDYTEYVFVFLWGDCPSGCTDWRRWFFRVTKDDFKAELISVDGHQLPNFVYH